MAQWQQRLETGRCGPVEAKLLETGQRLETARGTSGRMQGVWVDHQLSPLLPKCTELHGPGCKWKMPLLLLLLSRFSRVRLCATP